MIVDSGKEVTLRNFIGGDILIHFFTNDIEINESTIGEDLIESDAVKPSKLFPILWTVLNNTAYIEDVITFKKPIERLYGYFITYEDILFWVDKFSDGPYEIAGKDDTIKLKLTISFD